jgi:hypothetical protein
MLWDLAEGKRLYSLDAGDIIHSLCFSPNRCAQRRQQRAPPDLPAIRALLSSPPLLPRGCRRPPPPAPCAAQVLAGGRHPDLNQDLGP